MNNLVSKNGRHFFPEMRDTFSYPLEKYFNDIFDNFFKEDFGLKTSAGYPKMDVLRDGQNLVVEMAVPGVTLEDLKVEVDNNNLLTIRGKMSEEHSSPPNASYFRRELKKSAFIQQMTLPPEVTGDPDAVLKNGILKLSWVLPESKVKDAPRMIEVKSG